MAHDDGGNRIFIGKERGRRIDEESMQALRGGWNLGEESFKDKLLGPIDGAGAKGEEEGSEEKRIIRLVGDDPGLLRTGALTFPTTVGQMYAIERSTNLEEPDWAPVTPSMPGTGSPLTFRPHLAPRLFYRIVAGE